MFPRTPNLLKLSRRDSGLLLLVGLALGCILGFLLSSHQTTGEPTGGWRRIDQQALMHRIHSGDLVNKKAEWYHEVTYDKDRHL